MASGRVNVLRGRDMCAYVKDEYNRHRHGNKGTIDRKRKVAPTVMDQDVKKVRILSEGKVQTLHSCSPVKYESGDSNLSEKSAISYSPPSPMEMGEFREGERLEEGECFETRDILMSRWSSGSESPADSCVSDIEHMAKRKGIARQKNVCETDFDKQQIPSSEGEEEYSDDELNKNDDTEIDEKDKVEGDLLSEDEKTGYENQVDPLPKRSVNMLHSCRSVFEYERLDRISEGAYGVVYKARDKKSGEIVALKKVKMGSEKEGGFPLSALREINILLSIHDPSIVNVKEVVMGGIDDVFMVMEYMEHDLKRTLEVMKYPFSVSEVKCLMLQLLKGVKYLHDNWVIHRDLKSSNLLLNNMGEMKICDFGLSRQYGSRSKLYTQLVVTLWYRAPELLLGSKHYSTAIDMWSVGCIMAEMLRKEPLFKGKVEVDQIEKIFRTLGTPNESTWPGFSKLPGSSAKYARQPFNQLRKIFPATSFTGSPALSEAGFDLLTKLLTYNPEQRITAEDALNHEWFNELPLPKSKEFMPTFPVQNEHSRHGSR